MAAQDGRAALTARGLRKVFGRRSRSRTSTSTSRRCVGGLAAMGALFFNFVLLIPVGIVITAAFITLPLAPATMVSIAFAAVYGYAGWVTGRAMATRRLSWRMPELLEAVSPRQAA